jgi:cystathionine beta-lyase family protein involved in aluminum resistance
MNGRLEAIYRSEYGLSSELMKLSEQCEGEIRHVFDGIEHIREINQLKVIQAMQENNLSDSHFAGTTGYGYGDRGREVLDTIYAQVFKAEDALVRYSISTGTQAIAICMYAMLRPGQELLSITGKPYDTLQEVIGVRGQGMGSLKELGVGYRQVELLEGSRFDYEGIKEALSGRTGMVFIQRSRGYEWRPSISIEDMEKIIKYIKDINDNVVVLVDNCYGEFVEDREPVEAGADIVAGSLIKNPGGGLAPCGGYIAGKREYVNKAAYRFTVPGLGSKVGATLGNNRLLFQGLFMAPHIVAESLKGAVYSASLMEKLGYETSPGVDEKRSDIIQAIKIGSRDKLVQFCQGIQKGSPVDAFVKPEPWDMPGYDCKVIMAAGGFIQGSSIELSADAPIREPYIAYLQGGLVYESVKVGVLTAAQKIGG